MNDGSFDCWEIPEKLRRKMVAVARDFHKQPTKSEAILWEALRGKKLGGVKFRRQQPIGPFVVNFYAPAYRLIVEVDGLIPVGQEHADCERQFLLESLGFQCIRVYADDVEKNIDMILIKLSDKIGQIKSLIDIE